MMKSLVLLLSLMCFTGKAFSCTCLPEREARGFCEVLQSAKNQPMFCIVNAKVVSFHHWGMYVEVLENIYNSASKDTILVWGDCGACCRPTFQGMAGISVGDTLIMSLEQTDLCGNYIMPRQPDHEGVDDYMLAGCGVYYMRYQAGNAVGWYYDHLGGPDTINYSQFKLHLLNCISPTGIGEIATSNTVDVYPNPSSGVLHVRSDVVVKELMLLNTFGQLVYHSSPNSKDAKVNMGAFASGVYTLVLYNSQKEEILREKVVNQQ